MENKKNRNAFLITCVSCIILFLLMCYLGISSSLKGTSAATTEPFCASGLEAMTFLNEATICCPSGTTKKVGKAGGKYYCLSMDFVDNGGYGDDPVWVEELNSEIVCSVVVVGGLATDIIISDDRVCSDKLGSAWVADTCEYSPLYGKMCDCVASVSACAVAAQEPSCTNDGVYSDGSCHSSETGCYCWDTEDGETCKELSIDEAGDYTLVDDSKCDPQNSPTYMCYQCNGDGNIFSWSSSTPSTQNCPSGWHNRTDLDQSSCAASKCYQCNGDGNIFSWSSSTPSTQNCLSGWHTRTDLDQDSCVASSDETETVTVAFNSNGGSDVTSQTITKGGKATKPTDPVKDGKIFVGWYSDSGLTNAYDFNSAVEKNITLYAKWSDVSSSGTTSTTYTGTYMNESTTWDTETCDTTSGSCSMPLPSKGNPTKTGYTFKGWGSSGCTSGFTSAQSVSSNKTWYACWAQNSSTSSSSSSSNSSSSNSSSSSSSDLENNPQTGEIAIFIVWVVALGAIVYSVWYFRKVKEC